MEKPTKKSKIRPIVMPT
ncbi:hypothetical protein A2U01_0082406, partial [Trifolium medium]|nr:hypothetical protein [Trifolium medium]